jgi:hypothetical protein
MIRKKILDELKTMEQELPFLKKEKESTSKNKKTKRSKHYNRK